MLEIINDVLSSEQRAEKLLQEARDDAARIRNEFTESENREMRERRASADQKLREELSAVREAEEKRRHDAEEELRKKEAEFTSADPDGLSKAVERSLDVIIHGPHTAEKGEKAGENA